MNSLVYTPILKSKLGEAKALNRLDKQTKSKIIPFFDVLALKPNSSSGSEVNTFLENQAINIAVAWNGRGPCYVDLRDIDPSARGLGGEHPVSIIHNQLTFDQVEFIPVVGAERDTAYKLAVRRAVTQGVDSIAVRLGPEDIQLPSLLFERVTRLISEVGASDLLLHVFMDFGSIEHIDSDVILMRVLRALPEVRRLDPSRIVFSASAFISDMAKVKKGVLKSVSRRDFLCWESLNEIVSDVHYADYGIVHPGYFDFDPKKIQPSAKIRYASDKEWLIVKGRRWASDTRQYQELSKLLCESHSFRRDGCWGSKNIVDAALGKPFPRALQEWVTIDQNNHITHTVRQLSRVQSTSPVSA